MFRSVHWLCCRLSGCIPNPAPLATVPPLRHSANEALISSRGPPEPRTHKPGPKTQPATPFLPQALGLRCSGFHVFEYVRANISIPLQCEHFVMESVVVVLVLLHIHQSGSQAQVMCHITNVVSVPPAQVPSPFLLEPPKMQFNNKSINHSTC